MREALALDSLRSGLPEVVAGHGRLDQPIRWVHTGELPNLAALLRGGEMLLTTGMGFGAEAEEQRQFVVDLSEKGVAALVVELGVRFEELPEALVEQARVSELPLIVLHREVPFVTVTEAIHTTIVTSRDRLLRRSGVIGRQLMSLMVAGNGVPDVLEELAKLVRCPVYLETASGELILHAAPRDVDDAVALWHAVGSNRAGDRWPTITVPIVGPSETAEARLVVLLVKGALDRLQKMAIDEAAAVVALGLVHTRQREILRTRERSNLLSALIEGRLDALRASQHALALGFPQRVAGMVAIALTVEPGSIGERAYRELVLRRVRQRLQGEGFDALVGPLRANAVGAIVAVARSDGDEPLTAHARATLDRLHADLSELPETVRMVVGEPVGWDAIGAELRRALEAAAASADVPWQAWHHTRELELDRLLAHWRDDPELAGFVERQLGPLLDHDRASRHRLLPTLEALFANGGSKTETARELHLNRQALYHRLERIEAILGVRLDDTRIALSLHIALLARPHAMSASGA